MHRVVLTFVSAEEIFKRDGMEMYALWLSTFLCCRFSYFSKIKFVTIFDFERVYLATLGNKLKELNPAELNLWQRKYANNIGWH